MLTLQRLKDIRQEYRGNDVIYPLLSTVIGECEQKSKNPSNNEILDVIRKMYKDNSETLQALSIERKTGIEKLEKENNFLSRFLPQPLTTEELETLITSQISSGQKMPNIMKYLSENYKGRYDGKVAVRICNIYLNGTVM